MIRCAGIEFISIGESTERSVECDDEIGLTEEQVEREVLPGVSEAGDVHLELSSSGLKTPGYL